MIRSWLLALVLGGLLFGCGDDSTVTDSGADAEADGAADTGMFDAGQPCETDEQCDDGIGCTNDGCMPSGFCRHLPDNSICDNDIFCDGVEFCDARNGGCVMGNPNACNDNDVCTLDRCDEESKSCIQLPRDFDQDGTVDWHCEGGGDCDDRDPNRSPLTNEVCDDGIDNDCDEMVDEPDCGRSRHDVCTDALDISGGGRFYIDNSGAMADYDIQCSFSGNYRDVVLTFTTTEAHDVRLSTNGFGLSKVSLRETCDDPLTQLACGDGFVESEARYRDLPAGTYFIVVADSGIGEIEVELELTDPTDPPANETCAGAIEVIPGETAMGSLLGARDDYAPSCGNGATTDLVYFFTTTEQYNVVINLRSATGDDMSFAVESVCGDSASELRCTRGSLGDPATSTSYGLPAGTYFIIVEGPRSREVDFALDLDLLPPTAEPAGDSCSSAIPLTIGTTTSGTLAGMQDDVDISCGFNYRDIVYSFELTERRDVVVDVDGGGSFMYASVRSDCGDAGTRLRCDSGNPFNTRLLDLGPGTYFVIVESLTGSAFDITVDTFEPTMVLRPTSNDDCASAFPVPPEGGFFIGTTLGFANDYEVAECTTTASSPDVAFELVLTTEKRVIARTDGSEFDTVLHVHDGVCVSGGDLYCNDDGGMGTRSLIDMRFTAGTWYFIVDGWAGASAGEYLLEIQVMDP